MNGLHLIAELHDCRCPQRLLQSVDALRVLCLAVCSVPGLTPVGQVFHQFGSAAEPAGATGAVILAESLDLYVCNFSQDNSAAARAACEQLIAAFAPGRVVRREIERGR